MGFCFCCFGFLAFLGDGLEDEGSLGTVVCSPWSSSGQVAGLLCLEYACEVNGFKTVVLPTSTYCPSSMIINCMTNLGYNKNFFLSFW